MLEASDRCIDGLGATIRRDDLAWPELADRDGCRQHFFVVVVIGFDWDRDRRRPDRLGMSIISQPLLTTGLGKNGR